MKIPIGEVEVCVDCGWARGDHEAGCAEKDRVEGVRYRRTRRTDAELRAVLQDARDKIDAAYWRFCRMARALPPVLAEPGAHEIVRDAERELRERRTRRRKP